jgi:DNA-binding protein H-NS
MVSLGNEFRPSKTVESKTMARAPQTDIENMSAKELTELQAAVTAAIAEKKISEKADLKARLSALASDSGFSLEELLGLRKGKNGAKSASVAKYRNPDAPDQTWTGRGRKPNWLVEKLKKRGVTMEEFAI